MKLLLHACCGPCSLEPVRIFSEESVDFSIMYFNPNIYPPKEYARRLATLKDYVIKPSGIEFFTGDYDPKTWEQTVACCANEKKARCRACYRLRLERVACQAKQCGFDAISTTLTISPYQFTDIIIEELERAANLYDLQAVGRDWRKQYPQATRRSRDMGMYRQNYCGCRFSIIEAQAEREIRKAKRKIAGRLKARAMFFAAAEGSVMQENQL